MDNFELTICSESGEDVVLDFERSEEAIAWMAGPDWSDDVDEILIEAHTSDGQRVVVRIKRGASAATVRISDLRRDLAA